MQITQSKISQSNWLSMRDPQQQREKWKSQFREKFFEKTKHLREQATKSARFCGPEVSFSEIRRTENNGHILPLLRNSDNSNVTSNNNLNNFNSNVDSTVSSTQTAVLPPFQHSEATDTPTEPSSPSSKEIKTLSDFINLQLEEFSHEERLTEKLNKEEHAELLHYLEQSLLDELKQEEQALIEQYLRYSSSEVVMDPSESPNVALCPVCRKHKLLQNKYIIFCRCGLRVDTKRDNITLAYVQRVLVEAHREHSNHCNHEPHFEVREQFSISALYMICDVCGTIQVII